MIGIGIDTGGTCTDAVVFDASSHQVLSQSKTLTTPQNLKIGIIKALKDLDRKQIARADYIALSTTLATNACVENKGGKAKLVFIGVNPEAVKKMGSEYGLPPLTEIYFMAGDPGKPETPENTPDWRRLEEEAIDEFSGYDSAAIVQMNPKLDDGAYEKAAEKIIRKKFGISCVRGYELYQELNVQKRGTTALLNARLLPVMEEFFSSIDTSLEELEIDLPIVIVRSDGSIMSREFAMQRPVETLLCGPAASIIGAMELSKLEDALIVDMGGTTSDVAMVKRGKPVTNQGGISIGEWKTMVKGVSIDTFALGGDSRVRYKRGALYLDKRRCIPVCMAAKTYPQMRKKLNTLVLMDRNFDYPAHEFFLLMNTPADLSKYTLQEQRLIHALAEEPLIFREAADAARVSPHVFACERLEDTGIVMRIGVTPTDVMHVRGDYAAFDKETALLAVRYLAGVAKTNVEGVCKEIYDLTKERLYTNLVRIFLQYETGRALTSEEKNNLAKLTTYIYRHQAEDGLPRAIWPKFLTDAKLIGIGAPTKLFLADVAKLLGTEADFPQDAKVANAIGAAMGNISTESIIKIEPYKGVHSSYLTYVITGSGESFSLPEYTEALEEGKKIAEEGARRRARQQGAQGDIQVEIQVKENTYQRNKYTSPELIETLIVARAISK